METICAEHIPQSKGGGLAALMFEIKPRQPDRYLVVTSKGVREEFTDHDQAAGRYNEIVSGEGITV